MKIDNRILLPILGPFAVIGLTRMVFWVAGGSWSEPEFAAIMSILFGCSGGFGVMAYLFDCKISIGSFTIGKEAPND